jgi:hypothetical protein
VRLRTNQRTPTCHEMYTDSHHEHIFAYLRVYSLAWQDCGRSSIVLMCMVVSIGFRGWRRMLWSWRRGSELRG